MKTPWTNLLAITALITLFLLGLSSLTHGPVVQDTDIAKDRFSAERALTRLSDWLKDDEPHPSQSALNKTIKAKILRELNDLGYQTEVQSALSCTLHYPGCTNIENILTRLKGSGAGKAILLTAHYDSVPAGPGAADDGAGAAAIVEIADMLKAAPQFKNDIIILITDGEEGGLRGAAAFAKHHTWMKDVGLVVNLEARGASGPSTMFETNEGNLTLIRAFAKTNPRPVANSLSYEIYKRLPNDTDYSIYKPSGVQGLNFAFTGNVFLYHSGRDTVANLDKKSLQHHGQNAWAALKAFGNADLDAINAEKADATYFDVFGRWLIHWPSHNNFYLAWLALIAVLTLLIKARRASVVGSVSSTGFLIALALVLPAIGWALSFPLGRWVDLFYLDHPYPWPGRLALLSGAGFAAWLVTRFVPAPNATNFNTLVGMHAIVLAVISVLVSVFISGASYLVLLPLLAITLGLFIDVLRKSEMLTFAAWLGLISCSYMALYHFIAVEVILSYRQAHLRILPLFILCLALLPFLYQTRQADRRVYFKTGLMLFVPTLLLAGISLFIPGYDETHPRGFNLVYVQDETTGKALWVSETASQQDKAFLKAAGFLPLKPYKNTYRLTGRHSVSKPASNRHLPGVNVNLLDNRVKDGIRTVRLDVQSSLKGYEIGLAFPFDKDGARAPETIRINGQLAADYRRKAAQAKYNHRYWRPLGLRGFGDGVYRIELTGPADRFTEIVFADTKSLKEDELDGMGALRPKDSADIHAGNRAMVLTHISLTK